MVKSVRQTRRQGILEQWSLLESGRWLEVIHLEKNVTIKMAGSRCKKMDIC